MAGSGLVTTNFRVGRWMCAKSLGVELENGFTWVPLMRLWPIVGHCKRKNV